MKRNKSAVVISLLLAVFAKTTWSYPPDNAAVLYYWAFSLMVYPNDEDERSRMVEYAKGNTPLDESIEGFIKRQKRKISLLSDASTVEHCDWGMDYSIGIETYLPELHKARFAAALLAADAKRLVHGGDIKEGLERLLAIHRMARHVSDEITIFHLVGLYMSNLSSQVMAGVLSEFTIDEEALIWLKGEIAHAGLPRGGLQSAFGNAAKAMVFAFTMENWQQFLKECPVGTEDAQDLRRALEKVEPVNESFLRDTRQYYIEFMAELQAALENPFDQAYRMIQVLEKRPGQDLTEQPEATAAFVLMAGYAKCLCVDSRAQTRLNAVKAAIELYLINIRTGQLPDALPPGLPQDVFSGRDFAYETNEEGFVLRCHAPDPSKETIHEYSFKVK